MIILMKKMMKIIDKDIEIKLKNRKLEEKEEEFLIIYLEIKKYLY